MYHWLRHERSLYYLRQCAVIGETFYTHRLVLVLAITGRDLLKELYKRSSHQKNCSLVLHTAVQLKRVSGTDCSAGYVLHFRLGRSTRRSDEYVGTSDISHRNIHNTTAAHFGSFYTTIPHPTDNTSMYKQIHTHFTALDLADHRARGDRVHLLKLRCGHHVAL